MFMFIPQTRRGLVGLGGVEGMAMEQGADSSSQRLPRSLAVAKSII
jgi:hypothetical protein